MTDRIQDRKYVWYTCGKCRHENYRLKSDESEDCSECGAVYEAPDGEVGAFVSNGGMEDWTAGAPDDWTLVGAGASVAQETIIVKSGLSSAKVTRVGTNCYLTQTPIVTSAAVLNLLGRTLKVGCYVYATVADRARIIVMDGVDTTNSAYHSGVVGWEYLSVLHTVNMNATNGEIRLQVNGGNTDAYFDDICQNPASLGGRLVEIRRWEHRERLANDVPSKVKIDLNNPNG